ncbi:MAG: hypothetical protein GF334_13860, partial [Candidatus Altiarchaeales archaeon]|nr:hypothetical protein [Candidatus Altiarchaeales archaeon]
MFVWGSLLGVILFFPPFLYALGFKGFRQKTFEVLLALVFFHLSLAVVSQALGLFNYATVLASNVLVAWVSLAKTDWAQTKRNIRAIRVDWFLVAALVIISVQLWQVHQSYTGIVTTAFEPYVFVEDLKYPYPYFSDEWVSIAFIDYCIESGSLPFVNPLWYNEFFINFEFAFHSLLSELTLFLGLNPLTQYTLLGFFSALLICVLIYFLLREYGVGRAACAGALLLVPHIVSS